MYKEMVNNLVETTKLMGCTTAVTIERDDGVAVEIISYPKGTRPANEVLFELVEWLECHDDFPDVLNKIEELEEGKE